MKYQIFLFVGVATLAACAPTSQNQSTETSRSFEGVWLKKSIADNFRSASQPECGSLITTSPTAFSVAGDGGLNLLSQSGQAISLGRTDARGAVTDSGIFSQLELKQDQLRAQSTMEPTPVEYVRSTDTEVNGVLEQNDACLANLKLEPQSAQDLENRAVLAKNNLLLAQTKRSGLSPALLATTALLTGSTGAYVYSASQANGFKEAASLWQMQRHEFDAEIAQEVQKLYKPLEKEFGVFLEDLKKQYLPKNSTWVFGSSYDHRSMGSQIANFDGRFEYSIPTPKHLFDPNVDFTLKETPNGFEAYRRGGQGKLKLTPEISGRLQAMRLKLEEINELRATKFYSSVSLEEIQSTLKSWRIFRKASGALTLALAAAEGYLLWNTFHSAPQQIQTSEKVRSLIALNDEDLRVHLRKHSEDGKLLIEAEATLTSH